ncbi:hypothetical protein CL622_00700 [archaeon]|nr:hypothetical protein [archaeon]
MVITLDSPLQNSLRKLDDEHVNQLIAHYDRLIEPIYEKGQFPKDFTLRPLDWSLTPDVVHRESDSSGVRPLSTFDVEFLDNEIVTLAKKGVVDLAKHYPCIHKCKGCFSQEDIYGDVDNLMYWEDVMGQIDQACDIGLSSVKFLGPGELFQNRDLFDILDALSERNMPISIFTKGAEMGDDALAEYIYGDQHIHTAQDLVDRVAEYGNVRILLGFNSLDPKRQDLAIGASKENIEPRIKNGIYQRLGIFDYTNKRNQALVNLVQAGFNDPERGQRLSLIAGPIRLYQIDEIASAYLWAAQRNIPLVIAPTMESGPRAVALSKNDQREDPEHKMLVDMMVSVYSTAIDSGILTLDTITNEGISGYMGTSPCNQVANGLFMRLNGQIQMCAGKSDRDAIYGNVHNTSLVDIWKNSPNYAMGALENNWCVAKTSSMPIFIQDRILTTLTRLYDS